jgi:DNA-binding GntR family transcriptional regulator
MAGDKMVASEPSNEIGEEMDDRAEELSGQPKPRSRTQPTAGTRSASDAAYAGILDLILTRGLRPGEKTSVYLLSARLGFGRMPVKEAVSRLQSEGVLSVKGRSGTTVATVDAAGLAQMFALRRALEALAAENAAVAATSDDIALVNELVTEMRETSIDAPEAAGAGARFVRANAAFHAAIIEAAHNPFLTRAYSHLQLQFQIVSYLSQRGPDPAAAQRRQAEHEEIAASLAARDAERMKEALRRHGISTEKSLGSQFS